MATIRQREIQPASALPLAAALKVQNSSGAQIDRWDLVYVSGAQGTARFRAARADAGAAATSLAPLWIARHNIPDGGYGVVVPWTMLTGVDTSAASVGDPVYLGTAGSWSLSPGTVPVVVGRVLVSDATDGVIELGTMAYQPPRVLPSLVIYEDGLAKTVGGLAGVALTSSTVSNTTAETAFSTVQLPANSLRAGKTLRIRWEGIVTSITGSPTLQIRVKAGGTVLFDGTALSVAANDRGAIDLEAVARGALGASVATRGIAIHRVPGATGISDAAVVANLATNAALDIQVTAQWSVADAANSVDQRYFRVEVV